MGFHVTELSKSYSGVPVLKGVDLAVQDGEIHALLGANGAGKSTLIKCVSGAAQPDSGHITIGDQTFTALSPRLARQSGVAVIYQELSVATTLNVYENVFLGQELRVGPFVRRRVERKEAARWLHQLGVDLDPSAPLARLSNAELQVVEIVKALRSEPNVLILDEPTASLTEAEVEQLAEHLRSLKKQRLPVLYVTHRLGEVFKLADRVTVLRGGEVVLSSSISELRHDTVVEAIAGRTLGSGSVAASAAVERPAVLSVDSLTAAGIGPISLHVGAGEIVGVFGLVGSGRTELLETIFAARRMHRGVVRVEGRKVKLGGPSDAVAAGVALVPSDRLRKSLLGGLSALDNAMLPSFTRLSQFGVRRRGVERRGFDAAADRLNLQPRRPGLEARRFSGGNQQKLVIARWLQEGEHCRVLLLDEPTQGVDVGARSDLYESLRRFASAGRAVVVTSSEPEELLQLADRVIVLSHGRSVGTLQGESITERRLLELAHLGEGREVA